MIDLPKESVVEKICEQTKLSIDDVHEKIKEKLKQLSGLISEDGAAHIVANDLGVQLYKTEGVVKISEVTNAAKSAIIAAKILQKYDVREFDKNGRKGRVANLMVGDDTARIRVVFWNDQVELFEKTKEGDTIQIKNPYVKDNNGRLELHLNERSTIDINPAGITVNTPTKEPELPRERKYLRDLEGNEENVEVLGTIVQVYDPRFFDVCPECNKKAINDNCPEHGAITPITNYVTTCFLDDGTANVRTTFWKNQTMKLFGLDDATISSWKTDVSKAQDAKHELLGEIIKVVGRAKKNDQYERIELTANIVIKDVDPEKEIEHLENTSGEEKAKTQANSASVKQDEALATKEPEEKQTTPQAASDDSEKKNQGPQISEEVISIDDLEDL